MGHALRLQLHRDRGVPVLGVAGDLDFATSPRLRHRGRELVEQALDPTCPQAEPATAGHTPRIDVLVLDATDIDFIDSAGLGSVVDIFKCVRAHRAGFSIAGANPLVANLLTRTGLVQVIALHPSATDAVDAATGMLRTRPMTDADPAANA